MTKSWLIRRVALGLSIYRATTLNYAGDHLRVQRFGIRGAGEKDPDILTYELRNSHMDPTNRLVTVLGN